MGLIGHSKLAKRFLNFYWPLIYRIMWLLFKPKGKINLSVGVVTYIARYSLFKTTIRHIIKSFPGQEIIVNINGYYDQNAQEKYLLKMESLLSGYPQIRLIKHHKPEGLSKLWNELILNSSNEKIFILNDDLDISPFFRSEFCRSDIVRERIAIINSSWSHFLISRKVIKAVGYFDERIYGVGGEDWDYEARLVFAGIELKNYSIKGIFNMSVETKNFSFGKNIETVGLKYTKSSAEFLYKKWIRADEHDKEAKYVRIWEGYVKLIPGMETPDFYDSS